MKRFAAIGRLAFSSSQATDGYKVGHSSLGSAFHLHRQRTGLSSAQQRALLGLHNASTDALWTRLQAMPLPRPQHVDADLRRIVAHVLTSSPHITIHTAQLAALLRTQVKP